MIGIEYDFTYFLIRSTLEQIVEMLALTATTGWNLGAEFLIEIRKDLPLPNSLLLIR